MGKYNLPKYNKLDKENSENNYKFVINASILATLGKENEDEFFNRFIKNYKAVGAVVTSKDMLEYMNISKMPITREMLVGVSPLGNPNRFVQLIGARVYVEKADRLGHILHPEENRSIHALHPSGRTRMSGEALQQAFIDYPIVTMDEGGTLQAGELILEIELSKYKESNGFIN